MKTKLVVATQKGFFGSRLIEEGTQFEVPTGETATWWKDIEGIDVSGLPPVESPFAHFTKEQIIDELTSHEIEHNPRDKKEDLLNLLITSQVQA